jgi:hypothetical protein
LLRRSLPFDLEERTHSFLFLGGDPFVAPAPHEYVEFSQERAVWQELGQVLDDMPADKALRALMFIRKERHMAKQKADT